MICPDPSSDLPMLCLATNTCVNTDHDHGASNIVLTSDHNLGGKIFSFDPSLFPHFVLIVFDRDLILVCRQLQKKFNVLKVHHCSEKLCLSV